ncbi:MAG: DNA gyrase inhibitor YacG [Acidobacteria bacterium]|nr:MAG: DNA gyrase inhibitor YacG [Acidobacteriota bacterium]
MAETAKCVYCRAEPVSERYRPFCSERCKMADLGRWLKGDYAVPAIDNRGIDKLESGDLEIGQLETEDDQ